MLTFFRSTQAYAGLPFLLYALLLQLPVFFGGAAGPVATLGHGSAGNFVSAWAAAHPWPAVAVPVVLFAIQGLQASVLANRHQFTRSATQLSALGLMLVWGLAPGFRLLHPGMLANLFLLFALISVGSLYKNTYPQLPLFNAGAWLGLASFFSPAYLLFFFPIYIASGLLDRTGFKELLRLFTGTGVVYFLAGTLAYFYGDLSGFLEAQAPSFSLTLSSATGLQLVFIGLLFLISLALLVLQGSIVRAINIEGNKGVSILYWLLLFTPFVVLLTGTISVSDSFVLIVPAGILLGLVLHNLPERQAELLHLLLLTGALIVGAAGLILPVVG